MSSREDILQAIQRNRPPDVPLPEVGVFERPNEALADLFMHKLRAIGGEAIEVDADAIEAAVNDRYPDAETVAATVPGIMSAGVRLDTVSDPHDLAALDLLVCEGAFGVAENGAIWVPASQMGHRAAPFLAQHLALVLDRRQIVWNMHEAYARLQIDADGFGAFIAGPSKTADIEQALVIGAHGPRSLTVFLTTGEPSEARP